VERSTVRTIETSATPEEVFAVAADIEGYPVWASAVKEVEVLELTDDGRPLRARMVLDIMIKQISYVLGYEWDAPHSFEWTAEPGPDLNALDGRYEFNEIEGGGTEIVYALRVEPSFSMPGFLRKQAEKQIVGTALRELKRQAERSRQD
jgi:ribosome-associated toxin RatA of RatAB toxin-antitoxin module